MANKRKYKNENAPSATAIAEEAVVKSHDDYTTKTTKSQGLSGGIDKRTALEAYCDKYGIPYDEVSQYNDDARQTFFAFLAYPDSVPANWIELLGDKHVRAYISPLHDRDINPEGTIKKPHYHVLLQFDSLKSVAQFEEIRDSVGGVGREIVSSGRGYARYLIHRDNPEKAQYKREDIIELSGADWDELTRREADGTKELNAMKDYIDEMDIRWFDDFDRYCRKHNPTWSELLGRRYTYAVYTYIKAKAKHQEHDKQIAREAERYGYRINPETGEVNE